MQKSHKFLLLIAPVVIMAGLFLFTGISAQESSEGLIVSPPYIAKDIEAGTNITETIKVINQRESGEFISIKSREVFLDGEGGFTLSQNFDGYETSRFEINGWLTFSPKEFYLEKGEYQDVEVTLALPETLPTNGYYVELAVTIDANQSGSSIGVVPEVVIPIITNYAGQGDLENDLVIVDFIHENQPTGYLYEYMPVNFFTTIENKGNQHVSPRGQILISKDPNFNSENIESTIVFNENGQRVLAANTNIYDESEQSGSSLKTFTNTWDLGFFELVDGRLVINWDEPFRIGHYYAQVVLTWNGENGNTEFTTLSTDFWVIPWKIILAIIIFVLILIIYFYRKYSNKNKPRK